MSLKSKHKKWEGPPEEEELYMKGDLTEDIASYIKDLKLPKDAPLTRLVPKPVQSSSLRSPHGRGLHNSKEKKNDHSTASEQTRKRSESHPGPTKKEEISRSKLFSGHSRPKKLILQPTARWHSELTPITENSAADRISPEALLRISQRAEELLEDEIALFDSDVSPQKTPGSNDRVFLRQILSGGTSSDRLSALTLLAQASPLHNRRALEGLKAMASKKGRDESLKAMRAIVDLWVGSLSPERKLRYLSDQPLLHPEVTDAHLVLWAFESWLKQFFYSLLQVLERLSMDSVPYIRSQSIALIVPLLRDRPEQEQNLLRLLVNKLGDIDRNVASKASYALLQLLQSHPSMKAVIVREISAVLLRPPSSYSHAKTSSALSSQHAQYFGVLTFTQIVLTQSEKEVAQLLVTLYFELFVSALGADGSEMQNGPIHPPSSLNERKDVSKSKTAKSKKASQIDHPEGEDSTSKLIAAILTGINRALPFAQLEDTIFDKHVNTLFRIVRTSTFNVSVQALGLLLQIIPSKPLAVDRFFQVLYGTILDARLSASSKQAMYLNILFKAFKLDGNQERVAAMIKRLLQSLGMHQPGFICGMLYLIHELYEERPKLRPNSNTKPVEYLPGLSYDSRNVDPRLAHATGEPLWELSPLLLHFHPSVVKDTNDLSQGEPVETTADLSSHGLSKFLDRFISKSQRKIASRGISSMQPGTSRDGSLLFRQRGSAASAVEGKTLAQHSKDKVPLDQLFLHRYVNMTSAKPAKKSKARRVGDDALGSDDEEVRDSDAGSVASEDADEAEIWKAMKKSMKNSELPPSESEADEDDLPSGLSSPDSDRAHLDLDEPAEDQPERLESPDIDGDDTWDGVGEKRKATRGKERPSGKRRKLEDLPTFASYDDYAHMLNDDVDAEYDG